MITMTTLMEKLPNREVTIEKKDCLLEKIDSFLFEIEPEIAERIKNYDSSITLDHIKKNINDSFLYDINFISITKDKTVIKLDSEIKKEIEAKNFILELKEKVINLSEEDFNQIEEESNEHIVAYFYSLRSKNKDCSFDQLKNLLIISFEESISRCDENIEDYNNIKNKIESSNSDYFFDLLIRKLDGNISKTEKVMISLMGYDVYGLSYGTYDPTTNNIQTPLLNSCDLKQLKGTIMHELTHIMLGNILERPKKNNFIKSIKSKLYSDYKKTTDFDMAVFALDESLAYCVQEKYENDPVVPPYDGYRFIDPITFKLFFETIQNQTKNMNIEEFDLFSKDVYLYFADKKDINSTINYIKNYNVNKN